MSLQSITKVAIQRRKQPGIVIFIEVVGAIVALAILFSIVSLITFWFTTNPLKLMPREEPVSATDGSGTATISPDIVTAGDTGIIYTISYTVGPLGLSERASIDIFYPSQAIALGYKTRMYVPYLAWKNLRDFMNTPVLASTNANARLIVERVSLARKIRLIMGYYRSKWKYGRPAFSLRDLARELARCSIQVKSGQLSPGEMIQITIGGHKGLAAPQYAGWVNFSLMVDGDGDGVHALVSSSPRIEVIGRKVTKFNAIATSAANIWEPFNVVIEAVDDDGQVNPGYTGTVYIDAPQLSLPGQTDFTLADLGRKRFVVRTSQEGIHFITARDGRGRRGRSNPIIVRESGPHLYWGDLHLHSVLGVGDNAPEFVLRTARDELCLDFAGVAMMDNDIPLFSHDKYIPRPLLEFSWAHLQKMTHAFYEENRFIPFPVFDWASNQYGHRLVVYSPDEIHTDLLNHAEEDYDTVEKLFAGLGDRKALVIPIWSGWRDGKFMGKKYDWGSANDAYQRLAEVYSSDGAVEFHDNPFPIHGNRTVPHLYGPADQASDSSKSFLRDALSKDNKLGIIAGGARRFSLEQHPFYTPGLTAVWAQRLTGPEIWDNLYARRAYATTGARMYLEFKVNGAAPGEKAADTESVSIEVFIVGAAPIAEAQVIKFKKKYEIASSLSSETEILRFNWVDVNPPHGGFYILRVIQTDGNMAWAGPIWLGG